MNLQHEANQDQVPPPFIPNVKNEMDTQYFEDIEDESNESVPRETRPPAGIRPGIFAGQNLPFVGFSFDRFGWSVSKGGAPPAHKSAPVSPMLPVGDGLMATSRSTEVVAPASPSRSSDSIAIDSLRHRLKEEESRAAGLLSENGNLTEQLCKLQESLAKEVGERRKAAISASDATKSLSVLQVEADEARRKFSEQVQEKKRLEDSLAALESKLQQEVATRQGLSESQRGLQESCEAMKDNIERLEERMAEQQRQLKEQQDTIAELTKEKALVAHELREANLKFSNSVGSLMTTEDRVKSLQTQLDREIEEKARLSTAEKALVLKELEAAELQTKIDAQTRDITRLEQRINELAELHRKEQSARNALAESVDELEMARSDLAAETQRLKLQVEESAALRTHQDAALAQVQKAKAVLEVELNDLRSHLLQEGDLRRELETQMTEQTRKHRAVQTLADERASRIDQLEEERRTQDGRATELQQQMQVLAGELERAQVENDALQKKSELQQRKIEAVVGKLDAVMLTGATGAVAVAGKKSPADVATAKAQKVKMQEFKWLQQKYEHEAQRAMKLEHELNELRSQKSLAEHESSNLRRSLSEMRHQTVVMGSNASLKVPAPSQLSTDKDDEGLLASTIRKLSFKRDRARSASSVALNALASDMPGVPVLDGILKVPKEGGRLFKPGWSKRFAVVRDFTLYLCDKAQTREAPAEGVPVVHLREDVFAVRIVGQSESVYAAGNTLFLVQAFSFKSAKMTPPVASPDVLIFKLQTCERRLGIEQKVHDGLENLLKVASSEQATVARRELQECTVRLKCLASMRENIRKILPVEALPAVSSSLSSLSVVPPDGSPRSNSLTVDTNVMFNGHRYQYIDGNNQRYCHHCHERLHGTNTRFLECASTCFLYLSIHQVLTSC